MKVHNLLVTGSHTSSGEDIRLISSSVAAINNTQNGRLNSIESITGSLVSKTGSFATTGSNIFIGTQTVSGSIIPAVDNAYDLGSVTHQFRDLYLSSASLYIDGTKVLSSTTQELQITTDAGQSFKILEAGSDTITLQSNDGNITLATSGGGDVIMDPTNGIIALKGTTTIYAGNRILSSDGNNIHFGNGVIISGSLLATGTNIISGSQQISDFGYTTTSSVSTISSSINTRIDSIANIQATTGSNNFIGTQTITGSLFISQNLVVQGSSSLQNITASAVNIGANIVNLNTANPAIRFAGLNIFDSGSIGGSGSFLYDAVEDEFIFVHRGDNSNITSSVALMGPQTYNNVGNEIYPTNNRILKSTGNEHVGDSIISETGGGIGINGSLSITGSIVATGTSLVSGSSQILNGTTIHSGAFFNGISVVSGSAQIDVMSTTNIARLATTGSNTFTGTLNGTSATFSGTFEAGKTGGSVTAGDLSLDTTSTAARVIIGRLSSADNDNTTLIGRNRVGTQVWSIDAGGIATFSGRVSGTSVRSNGVGTFGFNTVNNGEFQIYATVLDGMIMAGRGTNHDMVITNKNGSDVFRIPTGTINANFVGNVGVKSTLNPWTTDYSILQVGGVGSISTTTGGATFTHLTNGAYFNGTNWIYSYTSVGVARYTLTDSGGGTHQWFTSPNSGTAGGNITFTTAMTLTSSGNLLVGTTNADVGGSVPGTVIRSNGSITAAINMSSPPNYTSPIAVDRMNTAGDGLMYGMWRNGFFQAGIGATSGQAMTFFNGDGSNNNQPIRMSLTKDGYLHLPQSRYYGDSDIAYMDLYNPNIGNIRIVNTSSNSQFGNIVLSTNNIERVRVTTSGTMFNTHYIGGSLMGGYSLIGTISPTNVGNRYLHVRINTIGTMMYWIKVFGYAYIYGLIEGLSGGYIGGGTGTVTSGFQNGSIVAQYQNNGFLEIVVDVINGATTNRWGSMTFFGGTDNITTVQALEITTFSWTSTIDRVY